jgi:parallel beta-helix repeat protein
MFENCDGEIEIISIKSSENIIYNNIIKNSKGSITLRHGDRSIVTKNKFLQNGISGTSGIRIIGEDHLIYDNLIKDVNGGPAISINNGIKNTPLNGYAQVKNLKVAKNVLINNKNDFLIGISKSGGTLTPISSQIIDNIVYKNNNNSIFSYDGYGSTDMYYKNNYFYGYDIGKSTFNHDVLLDPKNFDISIINEDNYGTNDFIGPLYNVDPKYSEINIELNHNYHKIKSEILTDFYINENKITKLSIIGSVGLPANYGGWESLVENIVKFIKF